MDSLLWYDTRSKKGYDRNTTWSANILRKPWGVSSFIRVFIAITCYNKG